MTKKDQRLSDSEKTYKHLYSGRWRKERLLFLRKNSLCVHCLKHGDTKLATVVDHREPHRGNVAKFWDMTNWQPLCKQCHDSWKQRLENSGIDTSCDVDGNPMSPNEHW